jgi:RNA polymerase sigma factor (sigma-70 family)
MRHLRQALLPYDGGGLTDGELLGAFLERRDEAAFAALVRRHGPMVWGVCRRVLRNPHDAEDAFQATFLVLVRRAASVVPRERVGNFLYGVAHRTALAARGAGVRRRAREKQVGEMPQTAVEAKEPGSELSAVLDRELSRLPDKHRLPVVLCDLEGRTRKEVARQLGLPEGTLSNRLAAARKLLAKRLARHGFALPAGALVAALAPGNTSASLPAPLLAGAGKAGTDGAVPSGVVALAEGVMRSMFLSKLPTAAALLLAFVVVSSGAGFLARAALAEPPRTEERGGKSADPRPDNLKNTLLALDRVLWEAGAKGDPEPAQNLYAEEFVGWSKDGRSTKKSNLETYRTLRVVEWKIGDVEVVRAGGDSAILSYVYSCQVLSRDGVLLQVRRNRRTSNTWVQRDGGWVMVFAQEFVMRGGE